MDTKLFQDFFDGCANVFFQVFKRTYQIFGVVIIRRSNIRRKRSGEYEGEDEKKVVVHNDDNNPGLFGGCLK